MIMKIMTVLGARPQFIKAVSVSKALQEAGHHHFIVHTGQHYDYDMSQVFFEELELSPANINLGIGSGNHGHQTGLMLDGIEKQLLAEKPDWVIVYGDTNSTLAGALAAVKLQIKLAHVEAGLRSYNRSMPEEINRVLTDHCADLLFCPTQTAVNNLANEGIVHGVHQVGDTMHDAIRTFATIAQERSTALKTYGLTPKQYLLTTIHRASNTEFKHNLENIFSALEASKETVVLPLHPRTQAAIERMKIKIDEYPNIKVIEPQGYLDMLMLEQNARMILTDSGGIQKEAYWLRVPCVTLREETEWVETVNLGWNILAAADPVRIINAIRSFKIPEVTTIKMDEPRAASRIVEILENAS